jgi:hypothetical protein
MTLEQLRLLYHRAGHLESEKRVTFKSARDYFSRGHEIVSHNPLSAERLHLVAEAHKHGLSVLVEMAVRAVQAAKVNYLKNFTTTASSETNFGQKPTS